MSTAGSRRRHDRGLVVDGAEGAEGRMRAGEIELRRRGTSLGRGRLSLDGRGGRRARRDGHQPTSAATGWPGGSSWEDVLRAKKPLLARGSRPPPRASGSRDAIGPALRVHQSTTRARRPRRRRTGSSSSAGTTPRSQDHGQCPRSASPADGPTPQLVDEAPSGEDEPSGLLPRASARLKRGVRQPGNHQISLMGG